MKFSISGQEKCDLLIHATLNRILVCLTVAVLFDYFNSLHVKVLEILKTYIKYIMLPLDV